MSCQSSENNSEEQQATPNCFNEPIDPSITTFRLPQKPLKSKAKKRRCVWNWWGAGREGRRSRRGKRWDGVCVWHDSSLSRKVVRTKKNSVLLGVDTNLHTLWQLGEGVPNKKWPFFGLLSSCRHLVPSGKCLYLSFVSSPFFSIHHCVIWHGLAIYTFT